MNFQAIRETTAQIRAMISTWTVAETPEPGDHLVRLSPASDLAAQLREAPIKPMTGDEFRTYIHERATGRALYQMHQDR